jgi:hypothetical protein
VGVQRGAQFGAARVATAQRELRVGGAQVVMELGLGQRAKERALLISGGEVEEVRGTEVVGNRPFWVVSPGRSRPRT